MNLDISLIIAISSLCISGLTFYIMYLRKGKLMMTNVSYLAFCSNEEGKKIFLRALLYSTSKQRKVIENVFIKIKNRESEYTFYNWFLQKNNMVEKGSGLSVDENGVVSNHHFLEDSRKTSYIFLPGINEIIIYAKLVNKKTPVRLQKINVNLDRIFSDKLNNDYSIVDFIWNPDKSEYKSNISKKKGGDIFGMGKLSAP